MSDIVESARALARQDPVRDVIASFAELDLVPTERDLTFGEVSRDAIRRLILDLLRNPGVGSLLASARFHVGVTPQRPAVELYTRALDEEWLRTARPGEPHCVYGRDCEAFSLGVGAPLVARRTAEEVARDASRARMCVVCLRYWMGYTVLNTHSEGGWGGDPRCSHCEGAGCVDCRVPIVRYWSRAGAAGEYAIEQCLLVDPAQFLGLVAPAVFHIRSFYNVETAAQREARIAWAPPGTPRAARDVAYLRQDGYARPEETRRVADFARGFRLGGAVAHTAPRLLPPIS